MLNINKFWKIIVLWGILSSEVVFCASASQVGWFNTFIPGGGEGLLGNYSYAAIQASIEVGLFSWGYNLSAKSPMTLDGVPENIPTPHTGPINNPGKKICIKKNSRGVCIQYGFSSKQNSKANSLNQNVSIDQELKADFLQEIGIKYHMVNIFSAYQKAGATGQVDQSSIEDLFAAPFALDIVKDPYVYLPLLISLGFHVVSFKNETVTPLASLDQGSKNGYGLMYGVVYPTGSAAPEEMFFRGFIQNEFLSMTGTPYLAVPMSTLIYTLSHSPESYLSAGVSGLFLGTLTYIQNGSLKKNIAFHFWSDVIMGIHAILSLQRNESALSTHSASSSVSLFNSYWEF